MLDVKYGPFPNSRQCGDCIVTEDTLKVAFDDYLFECEQLMQMRTILLAPDYALARQRQRMERARLMFERERAIWEGRVA